MKNHDSLAILGDWIAQKISWAMSHLVLTLFLSFLVSLVVRMGASPFNIVLREDAYVYLMKSLEITRGNFVPSLSHPMGWSLFMAPFFLLMKSASMLKNMQYARLISVALGSFMIFPVYFLAKEIVPKRVLVLVLIFFTFCSQLIVSATSAYTEPLFSVFFLFSLYFIYRSKTKRSSVLIAALFAGLCYYVRTNGVFVLAILVVSLFLFRSEIPGFRYSDLAWAIAVFLITSVPHLYLRYHYFGSPTFYGPNSKFFVDSFAKVWSNNIPVPSLFDYLRSHTLLQWLNRFLLHGFLELLFFDFVYKTLTALLAFPFLYGFVRYAREKNFLPLYISFGVWIIGLSPVWAILDNPRHLYPLVPIVLIFTAVAIYDMFCNHKLCKLLQGLFIFIFVGFSLVTPIRSLIHPEEPYVKDGMVWAKWAANHIRGKIAIIEGGDLIMMNLPDTRVGGVGQYDLYAPKSGVSIVRPGYFTNLNDALKWFRKIGVTHIVLDNRNISRRPYLRALLQGGKVPSYLIKLYDNRNTESGWKVRIFAISWEAYERYNNQK